MEQFFEKHNSNLLIEVDLNSLHGKHIIFYTDEKLTAKNKVIDKDKAITVYGNSIQASENFCPSCNSFNLNVEVFGFLD